MSNIILANSVGNTADSIQNSGFFDNHGNKIGLVMATIWTCAGGYIIYYNKYKLNKEFSIDNYLLPIISLLLGIIVFCLYFILNLVEVKSSVINNVVGHVSLIPIYIIILAIVFNIR
jgi:hypothetical protein